MFSDLQTITKMTKLSPGTTMLF